MKKADKNRELKTEMTNRHPSSGIRHLTTVICIFSMLLAQSSLLYAGGPGTSSANFLKIGIGGRAVAMGEAQTAATNDAMATYWNPAGLADLTVAEAAFMHNKYFQDISQQYLSYVQPTSLFGTFGIGVTRVAIDDIEGWDANNVKTQDLTASDMLYTLSWGQKLNTYRFLPQLNVGISVKQLSKALGDDKATATMADIGVLYELKGDKLKGLKVALLSQNMGQDVTFISEGSPLPQANKLGLAYSMFGEALTTALDYVMPNDNDPYVNMGLDYRVLNILAFRIGYKGQHDLDNGFTYGVGIGNQRLHIDYAFVPFGDLGDSHRVSFGIRFGGRYRRRQVNEQIKMAYLEMENEYAQGNVINAYIKANEILSIAPWHRETIDFTKRVRKEFQELEDAAKREQLKIQIAEHFEKGEEHFKLDELMAAKKEFNAILALDPKHSGARTYLARIENRFKDLIQTFYENGMRDFAAAKYSNAKENFRKVLVLDPEHTEAKAQLVLTEKHLAKIKEAADEKARLDQIRPIFKDGLNAFEGKKYVTAVEKFRTVLKIYPDHKESIRYINLSNKLLAKRHYEKGSQLAQEGNWSEAGTEFRNALKYNPRYTDAKKALTKVKGQMSKQNKSDSQGYYKQGLEAFLSGDKGKAKKLWEKAVELDPENLEAKRGLERVSK